MIENVFGAVSFGSQTITYEVQFRPSRRTLTIEVHPNGRVLVRAPHACSADSISERVRKRAGWISRQLAHFDGYQPRTPDRHYVSGETHLYLGRQYRLKVLRSESTGVEVTRRELIVRQPDPSRPERTRALVQRWYRDRARILFAEALSAALVHFEAFERPRLAVRTMRSRWGSLSPAGTMTLNVNLVRASRACIEYVVTHELCHLAHRHHNDQFYRLLGRLMPDWAARKRELEIKLL